MFKKFKITSRGLYWGLIITFALLYLCVGFVSTLHSITFFHLANNLGLAILLGLTYELGQASVLFGLLMTKNKDKFLPWALLFLLTALQVTANVYASFKFMANSGNMDWQYWQKSILIGVQAQNAEMYQIIISWIAGALLPIVALGMTALVAQNIKLMTEEKEPSIPNIGNIPDDEVDKIIQDEVEKRVASLIDTAKIADFNKPSDLIMPIEQIDPLYDLDETEIGRKDLTSTEEKQISDYLDEEAEILTSKREDLDEDLKKNKEDITEIEEQKEIEMWDTASLTDLKVLEEEEKILKKRRRPPKKKEEKVVESKKEKKLLQKEEKIKVPQKRKRTVDPLKKKTRIKPIKNLDEIIKPSRGEEVIKLIESIDKSPEETEIINEDISIQTPYLASGVEVIDAKAIPKDEDPEIKKN